MSRVFAVAWDVLREARSRKWMLFLAAAITAVLGVVLAGLKLELIEGALAGGRLFGSSILSTLMPVDVALNNIYKISSQVIFNLGIVFGIISCSDFMPTLLSPGRIEHLLSQPLERWQLLAGTYLGVLALAAMGSLYATGGLALILGLKTGWWTLRPLLGGLTAVLGFATLYAPMVLAATLARSAALGAGVGYGFFLLGGLASARAELARYFDPGITRTIFEALLSIPPRLGALSELSARLASAAPLGATDWKALLSAALFMAGNLGLAMFVFDRKDY